MMPDLKIRNKMLTWKILSGIHSNSNPKLIEYLNEGIEHVFNKEILFDDMWLKMFKHNDDLNSFQILSEIDKKVNNAVNSIVSSIKSQERALNGLIEYRDKLVEEKSSVLKEVNIDATYRLSDMGEIERFARNYAFDISPNDNIKVS